MAESINISPQAISKWENGHSLPETSLLPVLAKKLGCSIDTILVPDELQILEAVYTDGFIKYNVTERLNKQVYEGKISVNIGNDTIFSVDDSERIWFVLLKYKTTQGVYYIYAKQNDHLYIDMEQKGYETSAKTLRIIDAYYGNSEVNNNVMHKINHYDYFKWNKYMVNHETFPSNPATTKKEYLSIIYMNDKGIHLTACEENESIAYSPDKKRLSRIPFAADKKVIEGVESLGFGRNMDCTWAGALTVALKVLGIDTTYEKVMGMSGACYRIAFHPVWDYSSVDGLVAYDYATPGYKAFGYKHVHAERVPKEHREDERNCIIRDLNKNIPVLAINLRVAPEWGVITGYEQQGKTFLCRTYFDNEIIDSEYSGEDRYLHADNWPFIITHFEEKTYQPSDTENLINSLKVLIDCNNKKEGRCGYTMGYNAYRVWSEALINNDLFLENGQSIDDFIRRMDVNNYCMMSLLDARRCAFEYIKESSALFEGGQRNVLIGLSDIFKEIYGNIKSIYDILPRAEEIDKANARKIWTEALRREQAKMLKKVSVMEKEAKNKAREFLVLDKKDKDKIKPILLEPKIIKKEGIIVSGVCGDGSKTAKLWQEYEELERKDPLMNKNENSGYEVRLYDGNGRCECYVGVCTDKQVYQSGYCSITLPDDILYAVFEIYPIEGYESQNKFIDNWLEKNKNIYEQYKMNDKYFAVEYYGEKFKGNNDPESIVEIWIPIILK